MAKSCTAHVVAVTVTSGLCLASRGATPYSKLSTAIVWDAASDSLGLSFEVDDRRSRFHLALGSPLMPKKFSRNLSGADLTMATAEKVFGWKNVHKHDGELVGKKQDKIGQWRTAKVPDYVNDPVQSYAIDERMKQLGLSERYLRELSRITKANKLPAEWATPDQRSKAAIKVCGKK